MTQLQNEQATAPNRSPGSKDGPKAGAAINAERARLCGHANGAGAWRRWGPYLSERQWGTVREDYSADGSAWDSFPHDHARSRAYRWGEDGIAGLSDDQQRLCLAVALWNGRDPILKERFFGLTNGEGNHGEDVKELYWFLDGTPTHSYMKMLYKYPQQEYPYEQLVRESRARGVGEPEFELIDTGAFDEDRYFDVEVEHAKADVDDVLVRITAINRGPDAAELHVLPQTWFRNTWTWKGEEKPSIRQVHDGALVVTHGTLGEYRIECDADAPALFCDNETNAARLWGQGQTSPPFPKDAINDAVVRGRSDAVNPMKEGTKAAWHVRLTIPAGQRRVVRVRLRRAGHAEALSPAFDGFDRTIQERIREADAFYADIQRGMSDPEHIRVQRQAFAGMLWSKQFYNYDVREWLAGDPGQPPPPRERRAGRNNAWDHLNNADVISMPDTWEYPWYAAWDLAFHCIPLALIDAEFAKAQLSLLTREWYMHPSGQLPAYEWALSDVNPPVHAWATWRVFQIDRQQRGDHGDLAFLESVFHKLMLNFTWWVNRKDATGRNIFQGGFLGLDNIGVFDRSAPLPTGGHINQADGTSWMAMYALNLMRIALELAQHNPVYEDIATKYFEHFLHIAQAMTSMGDAGVSLWDETDEFFYDVLCTPDGKQTPLRVRSMVGLIPLFAVETIEPELLAKVPGFARRLAWVMKHRPDLAALVSHWDQPGRGKRRLLSLLRGHRMKALLKRTLDSTEFLSPYGVRALSKVHEQSPYQFQTSGGTLSVRYQPAESDSGVFGGNSNWRGPIWFPVNHLLIESLRKFHHYYGDEFRVECPTGSGTMLTLDQVATELSRRLCSLFKPDAGGRRPADAGHPKLADDPYFRDLVHFYEYFHGDTGRGVGASHQTGWTGLVAELLMAPDAG